MNGKEAEDSLAVRTTTLPLSLCEILVVHVPSQLDEATRMSAGSLVGRERKWIGEAQNGYLGVVVEVEHTRSCLLDGGRACGLVLISLSLDCLDC